MLEIKEKLYFKHARELPVKLTDWIGSMSSLIVHSVFFIGIFALHIAGYSLDTILLILTTILSVEAIYLAIFIQMTVNRHSESLTEMEIDIDEIQEDIEDIEEDIDEIEDEEKREALADARMQKVLTNIEGRLENLITDIEKLRR